MHFCILGYTTPDLDLELLDVDRGVGILLHQLLADDDGVLEVVASHPLSDRGCLNMGQPERNTSPNARATDRKELARDYRGRQIDLAQRLAEIAPGAAPKRVFFTNSGAEALEAALKLARWH